MEAQPLTVRIWVDGHLVLRHHVALDRLIAQQEFHEGIVQHAEDRGSTWMIELYDPEEPAEQQYMRFGTDPAGMIAPETWENPHHPWLEPTR